MNRLLGIFIILISLTSQGQELFETARGLRSLGMGGVIIPIVNDADAVFFNPANLETSKGFSLKAADVGLGANGLEAYNTFQNLSNISSPSGYNSLFGKRIWAGAYGKVAIATPVIAVGYLTDYQVNFEVNNPSNPSVNTYFLNDQITAIGSSFSLAPGLTGGLTIKQVKRWGGSNSSLGLSQIASSSGISGIGSNFNDKGVGYGADLALSTALDTRIKANVSTVLYDVGGTSFTATSGNAPVRREQNLALGIGGGVDLPGLDVTFGAEARHLLSPSVSLGKKLHAGAEVSLPFVDLRAGFNQGYLSYGFGLNFFIFRLDAVSYTEELGAYPGQSPENRLQIGLSFDLAFDVNFKLTDSNGAKRRLKQRR